MKDREIDEILAQSKHAASNVDPALLERIGKSVGTSIAPVRPLPPAWVLVGALASLCVVVALAGAAHAGFTGGHNLSALRRALIFPSLAILIWLAATACVGEMIPGSRRWVAPGTLLGFGCLFMVAVFAMVFHDYHTENFVPVGLVCLAAGLLIAIPTGLCGWLLVRRGFAVNPVTAGLAGGTLAGLAGLTMLEFHCPNFEALHVMTWHVAVVPLSAAAGALLAWALRPRTDSVASRR